MKNVCYTIITIFLFVACQPPETEKTISIDNKYSLTIPSFLTKTNNLNEDASLQYQNEWKEFFVIVIDESKTEVQTALVQFGLIDDYPIDISGYSSWIIDGFENAIPVSKKSNIVDTTIDNLAAKHLTFKANVEGIDAFYSLAIIEGQDRYYQIMAWTLGSKESQYGEKMRQLIYSFKEL